MSITIPSDQRANSVVLNQMRMYLLALSNEFGYLTKRLLRPSIVSLDGVRLDTCLPGITRQLRNRIYRNSYEWQERKIISANLSPYDMVLEIGAGMGIISTLCAKRIGGERVNCYEANPALEPIIRRTHSLNRVVPRLTIACVGPEDGERTFYVKEQLVSSSPTQRSGASQAITVPQLGLQGLLHAFQPTFLIADVEGYETELFSRVDLSSVTKMCIELHPHVIGNEATSRIIQNILNQGFSLEMDTSQGRVAFFSRRHGREAGRPNAAPDARASVKTSVQFLRFN